MSKKRQTRNTKKMQKALGSKRSRAGYYVGGSARDGAYTLPDGTTYRIPGDQNNNNNTPATPKKEAPIGLEMKRPDAVELPQVTVEKIEEGPASKTLQMDAVAPATAGTAQATEAVAETTGPAALAEAPTPVEAATYEAALAEALPKGEAAQGKVSEEAVAKFVPGTLTQAPKAVERDRGQEQAVFSRYCYIYYFK
jgi:hypothetical protein